MTTTDRPVAASGTFSLGGDLPVSRLGYGAMRITGKGIWGPPADPEESKRVLRRAVELGVDFIDTADSYGPFVSEDLIREALHPYDGIVVATKCGLTRTGNGAWAPDGRPEYLKSACEASLGRLCLETIDLLQLHRPDPKVPFADSVGALKELREEGKIRHVGLSNVSVAQLDEARRIVEIASVQNEYNLGNRESDDVLQACERDGIAFLPWYPLDAGRLARPGGPVEEVARRQGATAAQVALAWLLRRSPLTIPIPGTASVVHLEENMAAADLELTDSDLTTLA